MSHAKTKEEQLAEMVRNWIESGNNLNKGLESDESPSLHDGPGVVVRTSTENSSRTLNALSASMRKKSSLLQTDWNLSVTFRGATVLKCSHSSLIKPTFRCQQLDEGEWIDIIKKNP